MSYTVTQIIESRNKVVDFGCIYMIKNIKNNKCYIGQSYTFFKRCISHINNARINKGISFDKEMHAKENDFIFIVLITYNKLNVNFFNRKIRTIKEHELINKYKTYTPFGYNIRRYESIQIK